MEFSIDFNSEISEPSNKTNVSTSINGNEEEDELEEIDDTNEWVMSDIDVKCDLPVLVSTLMKKLRSYQNSWVHTVPLQLNQEFKPSLGRSFFTVLSLEFMDLKSDVYMFAKADPMTMLSNIYSSAYIPGYDADGCFKTFAVNRLKSVTVLQTYDMSLSDVNDFIDNCLKTKVQPVSDNIFVKISEI